MNKLWIVIKEVYRKNVKTWAFLAMVLGPLIPLIIGGAVGWFMQSEETKQLSNPIGIVTSDDQFEEYAKQIKDTNTYTFYASTKEAVEQLKQGDINGVLTFSLEDGRAVFTKLDDGPDVNTAPLVQMVNDYQYEEGLKELGIQVEEIQQLKQHPILIEEKRLVIDKEGNIEEKADNPFDAKIGVAFILGFSLFFFIVTYTSLIAQEVAQEKGSRVMEIILSSMKAKDYYFGKIVGILLVILTQVMTYIIFGFIAYGVVTKVFDFDLPTELIDFNSLISISLAQIGILGVLGILLYVSLAAVLGSLVSRTEDVQKIIQPAVFTAVIGFYIGMYTLSAPNSPIVKVASLIPFWSPIIMPYRIALEMVSPTTVWLSVLGTLALTGLSLWIGSEFYKSNVLTTTDKGLVTTIERSFQTWKSERSTD